MPINQLNPLRFAVKVAELGSFSAAARACGVTQPTVSGAVADLEAALGLRLFARTTRQLAPTPAGRQLLPRMAAVLEAAGDFDAAVTQLVQPLRAELRLGCTPLVGASRLGALLAPFRHAAPEVAIVFEETGIAELDERLDHGALDVVFGTGFAREARRGRTTVLADPLLYLPRQPTRLVSQVVTLAEAAADVLLFTEDRCGLASATRALFAAADQAWTEYAGKAMSYGALEDWATLGLGGAVLPEPHVRDRALARALVDRAGNPVILRSEAVWRRDLLIGEAARRLVFTLQKVSPVLSSGSTSGAARSAAASLRRVGTMPPAD